MSEEVWDEERNNLSILRSKISEQKGEIDTLKSTIRGLISDKALAKSLDERAQLVVALDRAKSVVVGYSNLRKACKTLLNCLYGATKMGLVRESESIAFGIEKVCDALEEKGVQVVPQMEAPNSGGEVPINEGADRPTGDPQQHKTDKGGTPETPV